MAKEKKRKRTQEADTASNGHLDTSKPSAVFKPKKARLHTLSVALPGSIIANAKSHDQKTFLAGNIARALAVFCVDEVIIFDDQHTPQHGGRNGHKPREDDYTAFSDPCHFLAHILSFLETPPYLRKTLFPMHPNLKTAGTLPSLDMPHHLRMNEPSVYREGVVSSMTPEGSEIDVGLSEKSFLRVIQIPPKTRVTVKTRSRGQEVDAVPPTAPREEAGYYWGFSVRRCASLSAVFTECPFDGGYDLSFGTSERGKSVEETLRTDDVPFTHLLVVLGGVAGLEVAAQNDPDLVGKGIGAENVADLFDHWINILPGQGSRTIRTEEALWLGLMALRSTVEKSNE